VGAVAGLIAHHATVLSLAIEGAILVGLVVFIGSIWLRERRRRTDSTRRVPEMRD
jgi:hypothetical protein